MRTARLPSKLLPAALAAVVALPYTAPTVCGVLGRMGGEMEMTADADTATVRAPNSGGMCCTLGECGVPQVAPAAYDLNILQGVATGWATLPAPLSAPPNSVVTPLTPPPQA